MLNMFDLLWNSKWFINDINDFINRYLDHHVIENMTIVLESQKPKKKIESFYLYKLSFFFPKFNYIVTN